MGHCVMGAGGEGAAASLAGAAGPEASSSATVAAAGAPAADAGQAAAAPPALKSEPEPIPEPVWEPPGVRRSQHINVQGFACFCL